jgi:hypothetical protein
VYSFGSDFDESVEGIRQAVGELLSYAFRRGQVADIGRLGGVINGRWC